jgi:hypothetical protein
MPAPVRVSNRSGAISLDEAIRQADSAKKDRAAA